MAGSKDITLDSVADNAKTVAKIMSEHVDTESVVSMTLASLLEKGVDKDDLIATIILDTATNLLTLRHLLKERAACLN